MFIMYTKTGTLAFASPERLSDNCNYTEKIDIWAAGIVLYMLLVGSHPFEVNATTARLFDQILNGEQIVKNKIESLQNIS
jgi:serine/threonine protein kinase